MARTLFLHCGPAKTGTSAIQAHLRDNRLYPDLYYPQTGQWADGAHHHLAFALKGMADRGGVPVMPLDRVHAALSAEVAEAGGRDVILSSEALMLSDTLPAFHEMFAEMIAGFDRVQTLVVLRHPLERAASAYNQNLKDVSTGETRLPDDFLADVGRGFALRPFVRRWRKAYRDVRFVNYHPSGRLLPRFLKALGRDFVAPPRSPRRNASLGGRAALTMLLANRLGLDMAARAALLSEMRQDPDFGLHKGRSHLFSAAATARFLDAAAPDLAAVDEMLGLDLSPLYPKAPKRLALGPSQIKGLRRRVARHAPEGADLADIDAVLALFAADASAAD